MTDSPSYATPERRQKGNVVAEETMKAGVYRERAKDECALDVMLEKGRLGWEELAMRRYDAGLWLKKLHLKVYRSDGVAWYSEWASRASGEMPDQVAWNWKCWCDTGRAMAGHWAHLYSVCILNKEPIPEYWQATIDALDALADHRHIA